MEITIKGEANEIAALVVAIQERQGDTATTPDAVRQAVREALKNCGPVSIGTVRCRLGG